MADGFGSGCNDSFTVKDGQIVTGTNHNGGINGGITNGMPLLFRCAIKPTPSIGIAQETVDYLRRENTTVTVGGRHDPAIVHRARVVVDSVTALVLCDLLTGRFGTDWLTGDLR
jgi:chorismate synthase